MSKKPELTALLYDRKGKLLSVGRNSYIKTHPLQAKAAEAAGKPGAVFLHAEIAALVNNKDWKRNYRMVISRYTADGTPAMAKPCRICQKQLKLAGVQLIEHT